MVETSLQLAVPWSIGDLRLSPQQGRIGEGEKGQQTGGEGGAGGGECGAGAGEERGFEGCQGTAGEAVGGTRGGPDAPDGRRAQDEERGDRDVGGDAAGRAGAPDGKGGEAGELDQKSQEEVQSSTYTADAQESSWTATSYLSTATRRPMPPPGGLIESSVSSPSR